MGGKEPTTGESMVGGGARPLEWDKARVRLESPEKGRTNWLATTRPDGRPHLMPLLGVWLDGAFYFITGERTRKGQNLAQDPRCTIATSSTTLPSLDVIVEGEAEQVTDETELRRVIEAFSSKMEWPLDVREGRVFGPNAPTAGPPPYALYGVRPATVFGLPGIAGMDGTGTPKESMNPTRWRFGA